MATKKKTKDTKPAVPKTLADPFVFATACEVREAGSIGDAEWTKRMPKRHRPTRSLNALISLGYARRWVGGVEITKEGRKAVDAERKRRIATGA